jgi:hypothetical protein
MHASHSTNGAASLTETKRPVRFGDVLLESIDYTIQGVLGEEPWTALFDFIEEQFHLRREDIPERLQDFTDALRILGRGAPVMTRAIVKNLCGRLGIPYIQRGDLDFKTYVEDCKRRYESLGVDPWS